MASERVYAISIGEDLVWGCPQLHICMHDDTREWCLDLPIDADAVLTLGPIVDAALRCKLLADEPLRLFDSTLSDAQKGPPRVHQH